jgi:hypothetical protein
MTVGELKRLIEGVDDRMPVLLHAPDHSYRRGRVVIAHARNEGGGRWGEDFGNEREYPEAEFGIRVMALIVE